MSSDYPVDHVSFFDPLELEYINGHIWRVTAEFDFASKVLERIVRVPAGFVTDFASVPRVLWALLPPTGTYGKAAVVHDYLYRTVGAWTRYDADQTFREAMIALQTAPLVRWILYAGVRLGGRLSFRGRA